MSQARATVPGMPAPQPFCAICTDPPPPNTELVHRPLGRGGALVLVCADCDTLHPRSGRYAFDDGGGRQALTPHGSMGNLGNGNRRTRPLV